MNHKREIQWLGRFFELIAYKEKYGHTDVSSHSLGKYKTLGNWVQNQRTQYTTKAIDPAREELLKLVGFKFKFVDNPKWETMFKMLVAFKDEFGHVNVSTKSSGKYKQLGNWVQSQRTLYTLKAIYPVREELLRSIGFNFRLAPKHDWKTMFEKLKQFKEEFGHVQITEVHKDRKLYLWVKYQRMLSWEGKLEKERYNELRSIGVELEKKRVNSWERHLEQLVNFKKLHGHFHVCPYYTNDNQLINFYYWIRQANNKNKLSEERIKQLTAMGFPWKHGNETHNLVNWEKTYFNWLKHYEELKEFKEKYGHCRVPGASKEYSALNKWVLKQRSRKYLPENRRELLDKLGLFEDKKVSLWNKNFEQLVNFKQQHGHMHVSKFYTNNKELLNFVKNIKRIKNKLSKERIQSLNTIGFIWNLANNGHNLKLESNYPLWLQRYKELNKYKEKYGHCRVPAKSKEYPQLGNWVSKQRLAKNLPENRRKLLDTIGFFDKKKRLSIGKSKGM